MQFQGRLKVCSLANWCRKAACLIHAYFIPHTRAGGRNKKAIGRLRPMNNGRSGEGSAQSVSISPPSTRMEAPVVADAKGDAR